MKKALSLCATLLLLVAANTQALTVYETFDSDPTQGANPAWHVTSGADGSTFTYNQAGYVDGVFIRNASASSRYYTDLSQAYFMPNSSGQLTVPSIWMEMDCKYSLGTRAEVAFGMFNNVASNATDAQQIVYVGGPINTTNSLNIQSNSGTSPITVVQSSMTSGAIGAWNPGTTNTYRIKMQVSKPEGGTVTLSMAAYQLAEFTGIEAATPAVTATVSINAAYYFAYGLNTFGLGNAYISARGLANMGYDNLYFSDEGPNMNHAVSQLVPEPATMGLITLGSLVLGLRRKK